MTLKEAALLTGRAILFILIMLAWFAAPHIEFFLNRHHF